MPSLSFVPNFRASMCCVSSSSCRSFTFVACWCVSIAYACPSYDIDVSHACIENCASPFKKKFCKEEKLLKTHSTTQKTFRNNLKKSMRSFNVGDVLVPKVESSSLKIGILLA